RFPRQLWEGEPGAGYLDGLAWSSDSSRLAYVDGSHLHVARADASGDRIVGVPARGCYAPVWSHNSRRVSLTCGDGVRSPDGRWVARSRGDITVEAPPGC